MANNIGSDGETQTGGNKAWQTEKQEGDKERYDMTQKQIDKGGVIG